MNHPNPGSLGPAPLCRARLVAAAWLLLVLVALASLGGAERAHAGPLVASASACDDQQGERVFLRWLDPARYVLLPDGDFSAGAAGWERDGATVVADNEPWNVAGSPVRAALRLRPGQSATSPVTCAGLEHPTLRLFARNGGFPLGTLGVEVLFEDAGGTVRALPIGAVLGGAWAPTLPLPVVANLLALLPGEHAPVAFRFTAHGGDWTIDDVHLDPFMRG